MKTGSLAQFTISKTLETVLSHLPTTGALFPKLSTFTAKRPRQPLSPPLSQGGRHGRDAALLPLRMGGTCKGCRDAGTVRTGRAWA